MVHPPGPVTETSQPKPLNRLKLRRLGCLVAWRMHQGAPGAWSSRPGARMFNTSFPTLVKGRPGWVVETRRFRNHRNAGRNRIQIEATLLKRPSKNAPRFCSSRLASRERGSFRHFMNQLRLCSRIRAIATDGPWFSRAFTHSSETATACRALSRGNQRLPDLGLVRGRPACGDADVAIRAAGGLIGIRRQYHL